MWEGCLTEIAIHQNNLVGKKMYYLYMGWLIRLRGMYWTVPNIHYKLTVLTWIHCGIKFHLLPPWPTPIPLINRKKYKPLGREKRQLLFILSHFPTLITTFQAVEIQLRFLPATTGNIKISEENLFYSPSTIYQFFYFTVHYYLLCLLTSSPALSSTSVRYHSTQSTTEVGEGSCVIKEQGNIQNIR